MEQIKKVVLSDYVIKADLNLQLSTIFNQEKEFRVQLTLT